MPWTTLPIPSPARAPTTISALRPPADSLPGPAVVDSACGARVVGHIDLGPDHHTPWGVVHGGVYTTAVESAASISASLVVRDRGQFAVGVHNATDFLRPATSGRAEVIAEPLQQGRVQQPGAAAFAVPARRGVMAEAYDRRRTARPGAGGPGDRPDAIRREAGRPVDGADGAVHRPPRDAVPPAPGPDPGAQ